MFAARHRDSAPDRGHDPSVRGKPSVEPHATRRFNPLWHELGTRGEHKPAITNAATTAGPVRSGGAAREVPHRARMESTFGADFSGVRAYLGVGAALDSLGAIAASERDAIAFASESPPPGLVAHELAHVMQRWNTGTDASTGGDRSRRGDAAEREADMAAVVATRGGRADVAEASSAALSLSAKNPFDEPAAWKNAAGATAALDAYKALGAADRRAAVAASYKKDLIRVLSRLSAADQVVNYVDQIREITEWVEEEETLASSKMTEDQIAAEQAKFLRKQAEDAAKAEAAKKVPKGVAAPAPTPAEITAQQKKQVAETSIAPPKASGWDALAAADKASWTARGNAAIVKVVTHATAKHPELGITAAKFRLAFKDVESRGANVAAFGEPDGAGGTRAAVGFSFTTAVERNPAYMMDVVVHEVYGHPEYGTYGTEYHLKLYDRAAAKIAGYVKPAAGTRARTTEIDAYAYQETEIYAVLRSMAYRTAPKPADVAAVPALDTQALVTWHVGLMKKQWAPTLIVAILRGQRMRLVIDPRVTGVALGVFDNAVLANFDAATLALVRK